MTSPRHRGEPPLSPARTGRPGRRACDPETPFHADSALTRAQRATVDLVSERGYGQVSVGAITDLAGMTEEEFNRHFAGLEDCSIQTFECIAQRCEAGLYAAYDSHEEWRDGLRAAAYAAAQFVESHPKEVRFSIVELVRGSELARARVEGAIEVYTDLVDAGRQELDDPNSVSRSVARAAVGSILNLVVARFSGAGSTAPEQIVPEMMYIAVRPYLGHALARQELGYGPSGIVARPRP